jgi:hypothetical protein
VLTGALLVAGIVSSLYAWQTRHPPTTADFTLFYRSAAAPPAAMYKAPPGPPRNNMNPPHFQLLMRPLTLVGIPVATAIFRGLSFAFGIVCVWWIARASDEPWTLADVGALLAWAPMTVMLSLNQVTWILWPLLVWSWWCWRQDRWTAGAVTYGIALSLKPFIGVFLLWLLVRRQFRAIAVALVAALLCFGAAAAVYGIDVFRDWSAAMSHVLWWRAAINGSLEGFLARVLTPSEDDASGLSRVVALLATVGGAAIVAITVWRTRARSVDESWMPLMAAALLASPLGWIYYGWWILPGTRPVRLLFQSPFLWLPILPFTLPPGVLAAATYHSRYFWGMLTIWIVSLFFTPAGAPSVAPNTNPSHAISSPQT